MARIVFELEIEAPPSKVVEALDTEEGIRGWWTPSVVFPGGEGSTMQPSFAAALCRSSCAWTRSTTSA
jgi:uncharacterized protein YndB with AHSA1/START domain